MVRTRTLCTHLSIGFRNIGTLHFNVQIYAYYYKSKSSYVVPAGFCSLSMSQRSFAGMRRNMGSFRSNSDKNSLSDAQVRLFSSVIMSTTFSQNRTSYYTQKLIYFCICVTFAGIIKNLTSTSCQMATGLYI